MDRIPPVFRSTPLVCAFVSLNGLNGLFDSTDHASLAERTIISWADNVATLKHIFFDTCRGPSDLHHHAVEIFRGEQGDRAVRTITREEAERLLERYEELGDQAYTDSAR